jgi:hypothetical protein
MDPSRAQIFDSRRTKQVIADTRNHRDFGSTERCGYRLICAFASKPELKLRSEDRLTRKRKLIRERGEVNVDTSDYDNTGRASHEIAEKRFCSATSL